MTQVGNRGAWGRRRLVTALVAATSAAGCTTGGGSVATGSTAGSTAGSTTTDRGSAHASGTTGSTALPSEWTQYHADRERTGATQASSTFAPARIAWSADLGAVVHGQVLAADGRIIAATENNRVVALNPSTGAVLWSTSLGRPLTDVSAVAGCGNIDPLGVTSTPVINTATKTVYVVGEVSDGHGSVIHRLVGLSLASGAVRLSENVDPPLPPGERAVHLLQRAGLALGNGRVYIAYGGNAGDCGTYHGWVVGVNESGPAKQVSFEVAADGHGGAVWEAGGAPAIDAAGHVFVTTGNANPDPPQGGPDPKQYTESVVELSADLRPIASYKDRVAGGDEDLATANPVLLSGGEVFAVGKTDIGYVLHLPGLTVDRAIRGICGSDPDGGAAYDQADDQLFVPCRGGGIQIVELRTGSVGPRLAGADSSPILIGTHLWAINQKTSRLVEFDARTGRREQDIAIRSDVPNFASPSTALGLLLVPTNRGVTAFR